MEKTQALRYRIAPLEMTPSEFRKAGYRLIDQVAELLCTLPKRPVAPNESPSILCALLGSHSLPEQGRDASILLDEAPTCCLTIRCSTVILVSWDLSPPLPPPLERWAIY